jgi:general secretion pathway protein D
MPTLRLSKPIAHLALAALTAGAPLLAQVDPLAIAEREISRRQERAAAAEDTLAAARRAQKEGDDANAYALYKQALDNIPPGTALASKRKDVVRSFAKLSLRYANDLIKGGEYTQAENVLKTVLSPSYDPNFKPAARLLARLEQPDEFNRTITPEFVAEQQDVATLLNQGEGYYNTGRFDLAVKRYEQVLAIDPYNIAARKGMEKVNKKRDTYYDAAYNETRSRLLWEVDQAWEKPVRSKRSTIDSLLAAPQDRLAASSKANIMRKLDDIVIPSMDLQDASIREVVQFLTQQSKQIDPAGEGVNIVLKLPSSSEPLDEMDPDAAPPVTEDTSITIILNQIPLIEAIRYVTELTGLKYKVEPFAVAIVPITENTDELVTREFRVTPSFIPPSTGSVDDDAPIFGSTQDDNVRLKGRRDAKEFLTQQGVPFPTGSFAQYIPSGSKLIVRNTQDAIDLIETLVEGDVGEKPTQVEIEAKFVEISQNNLNELGFDWLLGPFSVGGGLYGSGGTRLDTDLATAGNQGLSADYYANFPFGNVGTNPITSVNRSGVGTSLNSAVTANSINALIQGIPQGANVASPGVLGLAGIFTNPQFQVVIRALSQKKGVDLMSAPKVTTKSGNKAVIRVVREFPYPTEFEPPQVPDTSDNLNISSNESGIVSTTSLVTPATPSAFETRPIGVSLEVEPQIGADNYTIDLSLAPEVVEFDGFVNYGSPINAPRALNAIEQLQDPSNLTGIGLFTLTENVMNQPIFSVRKVTTSVSIWDGQTVALGGLIREDVQKVTDKIPILGDIPLAGRLFRSNVDQKIKKNLIVFVTARLMDAEGKPLLQTDEFEETVEPIGLPSDLPPPSITRQALGK